MTMEDWAIRLDMFLKFNERDILKDAGAITAEIAKLYAESEFEKYRIVQDQLFESDFDKQILKQLENLPQNLSQPIGSRGNAKRKTGNDRK